MQSERLLLGRACEEMLEHESDGARLFGPRNPAEAGVPERHRKAADAVRGRRRPVQQIAVAATVGVLGFVYLPLFRYSFHEWLKPDYSHGFLVIPIALAAAPTRKRISRP